MVSLRRSGAVLCFVASALLAGPDVQLVAADFNGAGHDVLTQTYNLWSNLLDKWYPAGSTSVEGGVVGTESARSAPMNPFTGATFYVNPDYAKQAATSMQKYSNDSTDAKRIRTVQTFSTGVWLDRIDALKGGSANGGRLSLTKHLDAALDQAAQTGKPVVVPLVVYDLPDRDCAALASNGELHGEAGLATYKTMYIDAIATAITSKAAYKDLRIAAVVEPDSLPNMITNMNVAACAEVESSQRYERGVTYAIQKLGALPNVALYLDIGHAGWLGWADNMRRAVALYTNLIKTAEGGGKGLVRGLATDIANYTPVKEPFVSPQNQAVLSSAFYEWNPAFDESTYVGLLSNAFSNAGVPDLGFIIDTSRTGWKAVDNGKPSDLRKLRGNWCNVDSAGMGMPPQANPIPSLPVDAFTWIKPPGESDGSSKATTPGNVPDNEGKRFDPNCDPNNPTLDAKAGAPPAGAWFHFQFMQLLRNAQPPISTEDVPTPATISSPAQTPENTQSPDTTPNAAGDIPDCE